MKTVRVTTLNKHDERLVGLKEVPSIEKEKYPTILLVHGFGVTKHEDGMFDDLAQRLVNESFLVYRFDFSGRGESEGDYSETSLTKLKDDLVKIIDSIKKDKQVDLLNIGILAQSFGTSVTIALMPEVKTMILMGSISTPYKVISRLFGEGFNPGGASQRPRVGGGVTKIKLGFWQDLKKYNLIENIKNITSPILFIHGSEDNKVPLLNMENYYKVANNPKKKVVIENADHGFIPHRDIMNKIVVNWFKKYLV